MLKSILTTTDLSDESLKGVKIAGDLAEKLGASLTILAVSEFTTSLHDEMLVPKTEQTDAFRREAKAKMLERLETIRTELFAQRPNVRTELIDGRPAWKAIVDHAKHGGFDTIVIATRGRHGLERVMLGSTTERVVRHAHCAVLTVHA
jgi:nucleotide-binding universal stress UspA family protein